MGVVKKILSEKEISPRTKEDGKVFVDLCENVHIHYREFRIVFSVEEYLLFAKVVAEGLENLKKNVAKGYADDLKNKDKKPIVIGGNQKNMKIKNPRESKYYNRRMVVEKQKDNVYSHHIHFRDFRIGLNKNILKEICEVFDEVSKNID